jgi:hypothetical protein
MEGDQGSQGQLPDARPERLEGHREHRQPGGPAGHGRDPSASGKDWIESKAMAERFMVPREVLENGPERFWIVYPLRADRNPADTVDDKAAPKGAGAKPPAPATPAGAGKPSEVGWYVSVPGPLGPCAAQITFKTEDLMETARQIALSVAAVVPAHRRPRTDTNADAT